MTGIKKYFYLSRKETAIVIVALLVQLIYLFIVPIVDTPDSLTYLENAKFFAKFSNGYSYYYRPPGYPFLIFLSGCTFTNSVRTLIIFQSLMAVAIPLLAYRSLLIFGEKTACIAAWFIILTLSNAYFSTEIMSEEFYIFSLMLFLYFVSKLCTNLRTYPLIAANLIAMLTIMVRGLVAPLILLPLLIVFKKNRKKSGIALFGLTICILSMYGWIITKNIHSPVVTKTNFLMLLNPGVSAAYATIFLAYRMISLLASLPGIFLYIPGIFVKPHKV